MKEKGFVNIMEELKSIYPLNSTGKFTENWKYIGNNYELAYFRVRIMYYLYGPS
jgi:hypothetical protein